MPRIQLQELLNSLPTQDAVTVNALLHEEASKTPGKIVVLDDDPTGIQTVHGVHVYTDWSVESIRQGFAEENRVFYLLTNSRSFTVEQTTAAHKEIAVNIAAVSKETGIPFVVILRGDSTLRGHYPLETVTVRDTLEELLDVQFDGEILCPFFLEGGRYTAGDIHYVEDGGILLPAGETEFAKDKTFGYHSSNLADYIAEKTGHAVDVQSVSLDMLRSQSYDQIYDILMGMTDYGRTMVNAVSYADLAVFAVAFYRALQQGRHFMIRSSASLVKVLGCISDKPLLNAADLGIENNTCGGLIMAGSHTQKTTSQLEELLKLPYVKCITFNQHLVFQPKAFTAEIQRVINEADSLIGQGQTVVVMTRRERIDANTGNPEDDLRIAVTISEAITSIVANLKHAPSFLVAKGGITSSDIGTKALKVKCATAMGQILPGIPVWQTGSESTFPGLPYVIFPGNVGKTDSLKLIVEKLSSQKGATL